MMCTRQVDVAVAATPVHGRVHVGMKQDAVNGAAGRAQAENGGDNMASWTSRCRPTLSRERTDIAEFDVATVMVPVLDGAGDDHRSYQQG